MKTVVVLSDSHRNIRAIDKIAEIMLESDYVFHLGDGYEDMNTYAYILKDRLIRVHGNCDYGTEKEKITEIEGVKILATHGDLYGAKRGLDGLKTRAKELNCNVVLYGHTHNAEIREEDGITFINPGNLTRYGENSFCYIVVNGEKITAVINDKPFITV